MNKNLLYDQEEGRIAWSRSLRLVTFSFTTINMSQKKGKGRPSAVEAFATWSRTCADAVNILKLAHTGEIDASGDIGKQVDKYAKLFPSRVSCKKNQTGWSIKNLKRNVKSMLEAYTKWKITGKGKKQQSKGTNFFFFES